MITKRDPINYLPTDSHWSTDDLNYCLLLFIAEWLASRRGCPDLVLLATSWVHLPSRHLVMLLSIRLARLLRYLVLLFVIRVFRRQVCARCSALRIILRTAMSCSALLLVLTRPCLHLRCLNNFPATRVMLRPLVRSLWLERSRNNPSNFEELVTLEFRSDILQFGLLDKTR